MDEDKINELVQSVFEETDLHTVPVKVVAMASYYGFSVFGLNMEDRISGMIIANNEVIPEFNTDKVIAVNSNQVPTRQRFTVAHELGHYIIDGKPANCFAHRDDSAYNEKEKFANSFASALLMPETDVREFVDSVRGSKAVKNDLPRLAALVSQRYQVSESAAEVRLNKLYKIRGNSHAG